MIDRYERLEGDDFIIIGGFESDIDAAYHLARNGRNVRVFDRGSPCRENTSDPSVALSTHSIERMHDRVFTEHVGLLGDTPIRSVDRADEG